MKANEAPKKLYFGERDKGILDIYSTKESNNDIEYIRKDAFIEKVINFLNYKLDDVVAIQNPDSIIPQHIVKPDLMKNVENLFLLQKI